MKKKLDSITERPWYSVDKHVQACNLETDGYVCQCDTDADAEFIVKVANNYEREVQKNKVLLEACQEAQRYILRQKGKEFNVKNADYFHISVVLNEAIKQATK